MTLGSTCLRMMRPLLEPYARARSTNIRSRMDSVWERMTRAVAGQDVMAMTSTTFDQAGPQDGRQHDRQHQRRQHVEEVGDGHQPAVPAATEVARR